MVASNRGRFIWPICFADGWRQGWMAGTRGNCELNGKQWNRLQNLLHGIGSVGCWGYYHYDDGVWD